MVVTSQYSGHRVTGLYVGADNVRRHFPRHISEIELQLDHLRIECELGPDFWQDQPEIHDPRLCVWLESKQRKEMGWRSPVSLSMIPSGQNSFVLGPSTLNSSSRARRAPQPVASRREAYGPQPVGGAAA